MSLVIRKIPMVNRHKVRLVFGGGPFRYRGRRVHNGRRYFLDLPPELASNATLYSGGYKSPYTYTDFVRVDDDGRVRVRMVGGQQT